MALGTYGAFAAMNRAKAKSEKPDYWEKYILPTLISSGVGAVVKPVVEQTTKAIGGVFDRPYEENERVWQERVAKEAQPYEAIRGQADVFLETHKQRVNEGGSPGRAAEIYMEGQIDQDLQRKLAQGEVYIDVDGVKKPVVLKDVYGTQAYKIMVSNLAKAQLDADDGKLRNQYNKLVELSSTKSQESIDQKRTRRQGYSKLATNWGGSVSNFIGGKSTEDLLVQSLTDWKASTQFQSNLALSNAWDKFNATRNPKDAANALSLIAVQEEFAKIDLSNFETTSVTQGTDTYRNEKGNFVTRSGVNVRTFNVVTGESEVKFEGTGDEMPTTIDSAAFNAKYDLIDNQLASLQTGKAYSEEKSRAFVEDLSKTYEGIDIFNLGALVGTEGFADEAGRKKLDNIAKSISLRISNFRSNKESFVPTYSEARKEQIIAFNSKWASTEAAYRTNLAEVMTDPSKVEGLIDEYRLAKIRYSEVNAALEAGLVELDENGKPLPIGYKRGDDNAVTQNPEANLTNGQYAVNMQVYEKWEAERGLLSPAQKQKVYDATPNADERLSETKARIEAQADIDEQRRQDNLTEEQRIAEEKARNRDEQIAQEFEVSTLDNILENKTTVETVVRGRGRQRRSVKERKINEEFKWGPSLAEIRQEVGRRMPIEDSKELLKEIGKDITDVEEAREINTWYSDNQEKLAVAIATNEKVHELWKEEGHVGLYKKYNLDYIKKREGIVSEILAGPSLLSNNQVE